VSQGDVVAAPPDPPSTPTPDHGPPKAFALGWHVAELYHFESFADPKPAEHPPATLPGIGSLPQLARASVLVEQIRLELPGVWPSDDQRPTTGDIAALVASSPDGPDPLRWKIYQLHIALLEGLTAQDYKLGKAYGLGRALAETVLLCDCALPATYIDQFGPFRIQTILNWLSHLKTEFADYAALAVQSGLEVWTGWVANHPISASPAPAKQAAVPPDPLWSDPSQSANVQAMLKKQGELWRSLLSGERAPKDLLQVDDYIKATEAMANRVTELSWQFLRSRLGAALALLSLAAILALIFLLFFGGQSQITSALVAALGSVGITVGAVGAAVQKAMSQAEKPLWDAEVGAAVVNAALITPEPATSARVGRTLLKSIDFHAAEQAVLGAAADLVKNPGGGKA
jgi:hypothetical protein